MDFVTIVFSVLVAYIGFMATLYGMIRFLFPKIDKPPEGIAPQAPPDAVDLQQEDKRRARRIRAAWRSRQPRLSEPLTV